MRLLTPEEAIAIPAGMTAAHAAGREAGCRGWATLSDLQLAQSTQPGWADAYRMGVEAGKRDRECIEPFAGCPQMPEEGVTAPPEARTTRGDGV